jgi:hypothetical protein
MLSARAQCALHRHGVDAWPHAGARPQTHDRPQRIGGDAGMGASGVLIALIVLVIGGYVGWQLRHGYGASSDLKVHKTRIPNFRKTRNRSWLISLVLVGITLLVLRAMVK